MKNNFGLGQLLARIILLCLSVAAIVSPIALSFAQTIDDVTNSAALQKKIAECENRAAWIKGQLTEAEKERGWKLEGYRDASNRYADYLDSFEKTYQRCKAELDGLFSRDCNTEASPCHAEYKACLERCKPVYERKEREAVIRPDWEKVFAQQQLKYAEQLVDELTRQLRSQETECKNLRELARLIGPGDNTAGGSQQPPPQGPKIVILVPPEARVGDNVTFEARVEPKAQQAQYGFTWYADGRKLGYGATITLKAGNLGEHKIKVAAFRWNYGKKKWDSLWENSYPLKVVSSSRQAQPGGSITGEYHCQNGGKMCFVGTDAGVTGYYNWSGGGEVTGTLQGNTLVGTWKDKVGDGKIQYKFTSDFSGYEHWWSNKDGEFSNMGCGYGTKVSTACSFKKGE